LPMLAAFWMSTSKALMNLMAGIFASWYVKGCEMQTLTSSNARYKMGATMLKQNCMRRLRCMFAKLVFLVSAMNVPPRVIPKTMPKLIAFRMLFTCTRMANV